MKKNILTILQILWITSYLLAQEPQHAWNVGFEGVTYDDCGKSITVESAGKVYSSDYFYGTIDCTHGSGFYTLVSNGSNNFIIDTLGKVIKAKWIVSNGQDSDSSQTVDHSSKTYITGCFEDTVDFSSEFDISNLTSRGYRDANTQKLSQSLIASFTISNSIVTVGNKIEFTDLSTGNPTSWLWDFGDGVTSIIQNPTHIYQTLGNFSVSLMIFFGSNSDTLSFIDYIVVNSKSLVEVTFEVNMNYITDLDTSVDVFYLAGNIPPISYWDEPGSNTDLILSDTNGDGFYSLTLALDTGHISYKYFRGAGWAGGEWPGDPNRTEVIVNDTTISNMWAIEIPVDFSYSYENVNCYGDSSGFIDITTVGNYPPFAYLWSNGKTTEDIFNLSSGIFSISVTDDIGNLKIENIVISQPDPIEVIVSISDVQMSGGTDGAIQVVINGGTPPYNFLWSNSSTNSSLMNISEGNYFLTITDSNLCIWDSAFIVSVVNGILPFVENPNSFVLFQNTPNPFSQTTEIAFCIPEKAFVEIELFNLIGEKVETIQAKIYEKGKHSIIYDKKNLLSGVYFYRLNSSDFSDTKIMIVE